MHIKPKSRAIDIDKEEETDVSILAAAIIRQAIEDYKYLNEKGIDHIPNTSVTRTEVLKFFNSQWFETLSCGVIEGQDLIDMIDSGKL